MPESFRSILVGERLARIIGITGFQTKNHDSQDELEVSFLEPIPQMICQPDRECCYGKRRICVAAVGNTEHPAKYKF